MPQTILLPLDSVAPSKKQSRTVFDPERLQELANSIREQGILQPILVRRSGPDKYEIIAGERRYRACKLVGLNTIPAIVKDSDDTGLMIDSFLENAQREDLTPSEKEQALISLWRTGRFPTPKELDKALGYPSGYCGSMIEAREFRERYAIPASITTTTIVSTRGLEDYVRQRLLQKVAKDEGKFGQVRTVRELKGIVEHAPKSVVERILEDRIGLDEARRTVELYEETAGRDTLQPIASALAEGQVSTRAAEKTIKLYDKLEREGVRLDPRVVVEDLEEVKRQSVLDAAHERLMEEARVAVLTGKKGGIDFRVEDPGGNFVKEVSDVAWKVQRWGIPNLMAVGASRWNVAVKYFQEIDSKMHFLLGYRNSRSFEEDR